MENNSTVALAIAAGAFYSIFVAFSQCSAFCLKHRTSSSHLARGTVSIAVLTPQNSAQLF